MPLDEFRAANRANWDDRVPIHMESKSSYYAGAMPGPVQGALLSLLG